MNGMELLESLTKLDEDLIDKAAHPSIPKKRPWKRWAAAAACICVISSAALVLWTQTDLFSTTQPETPPTTGAQEEGGVHQVFVYTPSMPPQQGVSGNASSQWESSSGQDSSALPKVGEVLLSPEVAWTIQAYQNTDPIFFLRLDFFQEGSSDELASDHAAVQDEVTKLRQQGYKVGYFSYYDPQQHRNVSQAAGYFTPEELSSLSVSSRLGCLVSFSIDQAGYPILPSEEDFEEPCFGLQAAP